VKICRWVIVAAITASIGCGKTEASYFAELVDAHGVVERQRGTAAWSAARAGAKLDLGDAVRTGSSARAKLRFRGGGTLGLDPDTVVRFQRGARQDVSLDIETGAIELESSNDELEIDTSFGVAVLERNASLRMHAQDGELKLEVLVGSVIIDAEGAEARTITAGQEISIDLGGAIIEDQPPPPDARVDAGAPVPEVVPRPIAATVTGKGAKLLTDDGWKRLAEGATELDIGARVRVARRTTVEITRGAERAVISGSADVVVGGAGGELVDAAHGDVALSATTDNVAVKVPGGIIIARAADGGTVANIDVDARAKTASVTARRGSVAIESGDGVEVLRTGEAAKVSKGGEVLVIGRAPARPDFSLAAGESPVVHDPNAPTAVRVEFAGRCDGEGIVEIARRRSFARPAFVSAGSGAANVSLARGTHRYRVRCTGAGRTSKKVVASGTIAIRKDSGRRALPRVAPHNVLDADGRNYRVLYQNLLPELTFVWPKPPAASGYVLHIDPKQAAKLSDAITVSTKKPRATLASGKLPEGTYTWWFEAGAEQSAKSPLIIDFDNAAATAYVKPPTGADGGATHVEGAVIEEWTVSVGSRDLPLDKHRRFSADVAPEPGQDAIAIRIAHPKRGVHYYLVRTVEK